MYDKTDENVQPFELNKQRRLWALCTQYLLEPIQKHGLGIVSLEPAIASAPLEKENIARVAAQVNCEYGNAAIRQDNWNRMALGCIVSYAWPIVK